MRVLMVTPFYYPTTIGGTESFIENVSKELNKMRTPTDIMTFDVSQGWSITKTKINGINVIRVPAFYKDSLSKMLENMFQLRYVPLRHFTGLFEKYDIIHFHNEADLTFPAFSRFTKKPRILHCHCLTLSTFELYRKNPMSRRILGTVADMYIVTSGLMLDLLMDLGVPRDNIRTVPIGINTDEFKPKKNSKDENLLLFVGRLDPAKGLHVLLSSLDYIGSPVKLVIIGPSSWNSEYSEKMLMLIERVKERGINEVQYIGTVEKSDLIRWYQRASILVRPDTNGLSSGMTSLEALACGTPVLGTGNEKGLQIIKDGVNGIIVSPNNAIKLAERIQCLLENGSTRMKYGAEGRRYVVSNFSAHAVSERLVQIYKEIL